MMIQGKVAEYDRVLLMVMDAVHVSGLVCSIVEHFYELRCILTPS